MSCPLFEIVLQLLFFIIDDSIITQFPTTVNELSVISTKIIHNEPFFP